MFVHRLGQCHHWALVCDLMSEAVFTPAWHVVSSQGCEPVGLAKEGFQPGRLEDTSDWKTPVFNSYPCACGHGSCLTVGQRGNSCWLGLCCCGGCPCRL